jgi:hypothetical protein
MCMHYERVPGSPEDHLGYPNRYTHEPLRLDLLKYQRRHLPSFVPLIAIFATVPKTLKKKEKWKRKIQPS